MHLDTIKLRHNFVFDGIEIVGLSHQIGGLYYADFSEVKMVQIEPNTVIPEEGFLRLHGKTAESLHTELHHYFGGQDPDITKEIVDNLRSERGRVDKMLNRILEGKLRIE